MTQSTSNPWSIVIRKTQSESEEFPATEIKMSWTKEGRLERALKDPDSATPIIDWALCQRIELSWRTM